MLVASVVVLLGLLWIALGFIAFAVFLAFAPLTGQVWAALITAVILLVIAGVLGLIAQRLVNTKIQQTKKRLLLGTLATPGVAKFALGAVTKRPMLILGLGGAALAAFLLRGSGQQKSE